MDHGARRYRLGRLEAWIAGAGLTVRRASYFHVASFFPALALAAIDRMRTADSDLEAEDVGELRVPPAPFNRLLEWLFRAEAGWIQLGGRLPFGVGALLLAKKCGVDPAKVREALLGGFAASRVLEVHGMRMLDRDFEPGFKARLHKKDMRVAMELIDELGMDLPATKLATEGINRAVEEGLGEADTTSVVQIIENRNDVKLG